MDYTLDVRDMRCAAECPPIYFDHLDSKNDKKTLVNKKTLVWGRALASTFPERERENTAHLELFFSGSEAIYE